jgi:hypothetical protein
LLCLKAVTLVFAHHRSAATKEARVAPLRAWAVCALGPSALIAGCSGGTFETPQALP